MILLSDPLLRFDLKKVEYPRVCPNLVMVGPAGFEPTTFPRNGFSFPFLRVSSQLQNFFIPFWVRKPVFCLLEPLAARLREEPNCRHAVPAAYRQINRY